MRKDHLFDFLLALAALPSGVAVMAAPEYIGGALKEHPGWFLWGGILLTVVLFGAAVAIAPRSEESRACMDG